MTDFWQAAAEWAGHAALAGGGVLALGLGFAKLAAGPALRQRIAAWTVRAAVLAAVLCLFPAWLTIPVPVAPTVNREAPPSADNAPSALPEPESSVATTESAWDWNHVAAYSEAPRDVPDWWEEAPPVPTAATPPVVAVEPLPVSAIPVTAAFQLLDVAPLLLVPYAAVAGLLLLQLVAGHVGLLRLRRACRRAPARVVEAFAELTADTNAPPDVLVSDRIESPVCFGLFRPAIVLPTALAKTATDAQLRWVLAHELDHLRRGDPLTGWWVGVARAVYFFVPWFWLLRRELHLAQEYLADAAAAADGRAVDYAAFLVDLSGGKARLPLAAHAVRAGRSDLFRRVTMLLSAKAGSGRQMSRMWAGAAACGVLSAAVVLSGIGTAADDDPPRKVEKKIERKTEKAAEKAADRKPVDEPAAERRPRDGELPRNPRNPDAPREQPPVVGELKKAIAEAAKKGDLDEVQRLVDRLERTVRAAPQAPRVPGQPLPPQPPLPPRGERQPEIVRPLPPDAPRPPAVPRRPQAEVGPVPFPPGADELLVQRLREELDRATKSFDDALEKMKDNPEARDAIRRAKEEYRKAMDQAGAAMRERVRNLPDPGRGFGVGGGDWSGRPGSGGPGTAWRVEAGSVRFGTVVSPVTEELAEQFELKKGQGVIVREVVPGTAAEKAGVKKNDVIVQFAGNEVGGDAAKFAELVGKTKPGEKVDVVIIRKGKKETLKGVDLPDLKRTRLEVRPGGGDFGGGPEVFRFRSGSEGGRRMTFEKMSVRVSNEDFEIDASKGDTTYRVSGKVENGAASPSKIQIVSGNRAGDKVADYKKLADVPEEHRAAVRQLLGNVGGGE